MVLKDVDVDVEELHKVERIFNRERARHASGLGEKAIVGKAGPDLPLPSAYLHLLQHHRLEPFRSVEGHGS